MDERRPRILVATSVHPPHDSRIVKQSAALAMAGYDCTLLAPWAGAERPVSYTCLFFKRHIGIRGRFSAYIRFLRYTLFRRWACIHFHDYDLIPVVLLVRLLTWQRIIYDVHENYGEEVMVRGYIPKMARIPLRAAVDTLEFFAVRILKRLVVVVPIQVERFQRWGCRDIALVRNFATKAIAPNEAIWHLNGSDGFVLNTGGQTVAGGAVLLVDAAAILAQSGHPIPIRGIDRFDGHDELRAMIVRRKESDATNFELLKRVFPHELPQYLSRTVIGISCKMDTPNHRFGINTKLFEYMAFGIPIIATDVGYQADIIRDSGAGILIPPNNPAALAEAIRQLWNNEEKRRQLGEAGRAAFFDRYCWENEADTLVAFYRCIL